MSVMKMHWRNFTVYLSRQEKELANLKIGQFR